MKLHLTLQRPNRSLIDLGITADATARIGDLADAILEKDPSGSYAGHASLLGHATLEVLPAGGERYGTVLAADETLGDVLLAKGVLVSIAPAQHAPKTPAAFIELYGTDRNRRYEIPRGSTTIGRGEESDIVLSDPLLSKKHARVHVGSNSVELIDLASANGIIVQGQPVQRLELQAGQQALIGGTLVRAGLLPQQSNVTPMISEVVFTRSPAVEERYLGSEIEGAEPPPVPEPQPFPWIAMLMPLVMGSVMFMVTRSMLSIIFVAMSPMLMLGTWFASASARRKKYKEERALFQSQLERLSARLADENLRETSVRQREFSSLAEIVAAVHAEKSAVWKRRPEHWGFPHLRLGIGTVSSRNTVAGPTNRDRAKPEDIAAIDQVIEGYSLVAGVPVVESFEDAGAIGVCGIPVGVAWYVRGLVSQIAGTRGPDEFVISGIFGPAWSEEFSAVKWLPHSIGSEQYFGGVPFADTASAATHVLACLEEIVDARSREGNDGPGMLGAMAQKSSAMNAGQKVGENDENKASSVPLPAVLVLITDDAPVDRARLIQLLERAAGRGVFPIWIAPDRARVPAACRTFVEFSGHGAAVGFVRLGSTSEQLQTEGLSTEEFTTFARKLSSYVDAGAVQGGSSDVPNTVSMLSLLGEEMATNPDAVIDRWQQNGSLVERGVKPQKTTPKLRAIVGQSATGAMHLDLRAQGPHALVGGTTGSGKSEFLQSWVLGMAAEYSPQRVSFLFVDYKGGAAFADCIHLPHCVGLVTDLSPHLVRRALVSLRAELHYRETLFIQKKAKDLLELEKRGDPEAPPALVIVIDEFAALVGEVPEFVDGVVDVAQRGRSLGIHLIMATQRPAGVIKDNLRANTNLRVALRMADEVDSDDVIGDKLAGRFDPGVPGRAAAKTGPGRLSVFQSAYAGGWSFVEQAGPRVDVETFYFGPPEKWETSENEKHLEEEESELGPNDQQRLVSTIVAAAQKRQLPAPRRPWLDELAEMYDLTKLSQRSDSRLVLGVQDVPQRQIQATVFFEPDTDGHLAVFGTGGSGKSATLRTLGIAAGITPRGGPVDVYGLDFGAGGLRMLESLPHVGAVIGWDSSERVRNLFKMINDEMTRRAEAYTEVNAGTITQYRELTKQPDERRILLLVDGYPMFRTEYEGIVGRSESYEIFQRVMTDGRALGIHVALSADRGQSVPTSLQALIQERVVLRMADTDGYAALGVPRDVLDSESGPGRAIIDGLEAQIAVIGGTQSISEQAEVVKGLAQTLVRQGRKPAKSVQALPEEYSVEDLPEQLEGQPVLGLSESNLGPIGFDPIGLFMIAGGPGSGRTNTMIALAHSLKRAKKATRFVLLGAARSVLSSKFPWDQVVAGGTNSMILVDELLANEEGLDGVAVFIEGVSDYAASVVEMSLSSLVKRAKAGECLIVSEADTSEWQSSFGLMGEVKSSRRGLILSPDTHDGEIVFKTPFPRLQRREFPPGRAIYVHSGKIVRVQLPLFLDN